MFEDLGIGVLDNAWKGYNCSLFAYGQTGSGKSYSMVGYGNNKGIVPMACEELFKGIDEKRKQAGKDEDYQVIISAAFVFCCCSCSFVFRGGWGGLYFFIFVVVVLFNFMSLFVIENRQSTQPKIYIKKGGGDYVDGQNKE